MASVSLRPRPSPALNRSSGPRSTRKTVSYIEKSSDSEDVDSPVEAEPRPPVRQRPQRSSTLAQRPETRSKRKAPESGRKRRPRETKRSKHNISAKEPQASDNHEDHGIQYTGKCMPWQTLPYHVLTEIFEYASVVGEVRSILTLAKNTVWLLRMAMVCKSFLEPALSTIYYCPAIITSKRAEGLLRLLESQDEQSTINYRAKIKRLEFEAHETRFWSIYAIMSFTPQLRSIYFHDNSDEPKYSRVPAINSGRSVLSLNEVFQKLEALSIRLEDWTWNNAFGNDRYSETQILTTLHESPLFRSVKRLNFVNEGDQRKDAQARNPNKHESAETLNVLPYLKQLSCKLGSLLNGKLMPLLPDTLETLEIICCANITSSSLRNFFCEKGQNLRRLKLDHNQSLNLSFLTDFATTCPKVEYLKMDLIYYSTLLVVADTEPKYDSLLREGEAPTWPATLQHLELWHLRKWKTNVADAFFSSLINSAYELPDLRQLLIKASLDESGWRDRIAFRDRWTNKLQEVFLRKSEPLNPHLKSIPAFKAWKKQQSNKTTISGISDRGRYTKRSGAYRGAAMQASHAEISAAVIESSKESDSDIPLVSIRRSTRQKHRLVTPPTSSSGTARKHRHRRRRHVDPDASSSEDSALEDDSIMMETPPAAALGNDNEPQYIQGMCTVVDILIDNLRPTEEQLHESDFLDEEASGDEDWNGDDGFEGDGEYAW